MSAVNHKTSYFSTSYAICCYVEYTSDVFYLRVFENKKLFGGVIVLLLGGFSSQEHGLRIWGCSVRNLLLILDNASKQPVFLVHIF